MAQNQLPPMSDLYSDLTEEVYYMQNAFNYVHQKDIPIAAQDMSGHCTFVVDWFQDNLPLEDKEGTSLDGHVRKMLCEACYKESVPPTPPDEAPKKEDILIFADQAGLCNKVVDAAPGDRVGTKKLVTKPCGMLTAQDIDDMLGTKVWDLIVIGSGLDAPKSSQVDDVIAQQDNVMHFMLRLLQTIFKKEGCCKRMAVISHDIFSCEETTNKERGIAGITNSTLFGFCNTARLEMEFPVYLIDTELIDDPIMIPHIATEVFRQATFGVNTVRLCYPYPVKNGVKTGRPAGRFVLRQLPSYTYQVANKEFELPAEGVIGISGGNGALGLVMGEWLLDKAEKLQAQSGGSYVPRFKIEFLSRSMKIGDLNMPRWKAIQARAESMGITVEQAKLDMSSQEAADEWFSKHAPNVIGFIHSAGILQDSMLPNQTWEKFEGVYSGKHRAALYIHESLERISQPNLKFYWMFSSTSVYGNMGQLNYSSSNSFMDGLARWRRSQGKPACAIQWGAWGEVGMAATMDDAMRRRVMMGPMPYFTVAQGLEGLDGGLRTDLPGFSVFIVNPPMMFGMIQSDQSSTACYTRNFSSEYVPPPGVQWYAKDMAYNIHRMIRYVMNPMSASGSEYYWGKFVKPLLKEEEEEEGNPFVDHAMF